MSNICRMRWHLESEMGSIGATVNWGIRMHPSIATKYECRVRLIRVTSPFGSSAHSTSHPTFRQALPRTLISLCWDIYLLSPLLHHIATLGRLLCDRLYNNDYGRLINTKFGCISILVTKSALSYRNGWASASAARNRAQSKIYISDKTYCERSLHTHTHTTSIRM